MAIARSRDRKPTTTAKTDDGLPAELQLDLQHCELYSTRLSSAALSLFDQGGLKAVRGRITHKRLLRLVARLDEAKRALDTLLAGARISERHSSGAERGEARP